MFGGNHRLFPFCHLLFQLVFQRLVFFVEVGTLHSAGGEDGISFCYGSFEGFYLLFFLLDCVLQLATLALTLFTLFVSLLGGRGGFGGFLDNLWGGSLHVILHKLHDVALKLVHLAVAELIKLVRQAAEEVTVMAHYYQGAGVLQQGILEDVLAVHIQVVGGLV